MWPFILEFLKSIALGVGWTLGLVLLSSAAGYRWQSGALKALKDSQNKNR